mgnify:CR=1 FL=1
MTILLLGATGRTGRHLLQQALDRGHTVHALVRDPAAIKLNHSNLRLFEGSPLDREKLSVAMEGTEAIVSALNVSRTSDWPWAPLRSPADLLSKCAGYLQELATARGIQRLVVMSAWGVADPLSEREREVLRLAEQGRSNKEIADALSLSAGTVRNYLYEAAQKLDAQNRVEAARIARANGWL